jgi:hypothetical protein
MEHTNAGFTLVFTQGSQDFGFVAQIFVATNVIPFEIIQFQTLEVTNPPSKKEWKDASVTQLLDIYEKRWLVVGRFLKV